MDDWGYFDGKPRKQRGQRAASAALLAACLSLFFLCSMVWMRQRQENLASRIAPGILRLHIVANSNSRKDQALKLEVKSFFLDLLADLDADSKEALKTEIGTEQEDLEQKIETFMAEKGFDYQAEIQMGYQYFPEKTYGDVTLPCGDYDAVQVLLGDGRGRNWWCVLYPRLCFLDITHGVVPEESKQLLKNTLSPVDYAALLNVQPPGSSLPMVPIQPAEKGAALRHDKPEEAAPPEIRLFFLDVLRGDD